MTGPTRHTDPRMQRTRSALQGALMTLLLERRYTEIRIEDLLQASGVGRSTFYENFRDKDALLVCCMDQMTDALSSLPFDDGELVSVVVLLEHLWAMRSRMRSLLQGIPLRKVRQDLVAKMEARLSGQTRRTAIPARLAAWALVDAMLSPILAWLSGEAWCSASDLASTMQRTSRAMLENVSERDSPEKAHHPHHGSWPAVDRMPGGVLR